MSSWRGGYRPGPNYGLSRARSIINEALDRLADDELLKLAEAIQRSQSAVLLAGVKRDPLPPPKHP